MLDYTHQSCPRNRMRQLVTVYCVRGLKLQSPCHSVICNNRNRKVESTTMTLLPQFHKLIYDIVNLNSKESTILELGTRCDNIASNLSHFKHLIFTLHSHNWPKFALVISSSYSNPRFCIDSLLHRERCALVTLPRTPICPHGMPQNSLFYHY